MPTRHLILSLPRPAKQAIVAAVDIAAICACAALALGLRVHLNWSLLLPFMILSVVGVTLAIPIFIYFGLYRAIFRYAGLEFLFSLNKALLIYSALYAAVFFYGVDGVPRSMGIGQPMLFAFMTITSRLFVRYWLGGIQLKARLNVATPVLIYGAGSAGRQLATAIYQSKELIAVGFVDDDKRLQGQILNGVRIYAPSELKSVVEDHAVQQVLLALPSVSRSHRNMIIQSLTPLQVKVLTLPGISEITAGRVSVTDLREIDIEDLLGRETITPDSELMYKNIRGKKVLVTGAGGSIGSELCRQILKCQPKTLVLLDANEFALYQIEQELSEFLVSHASIRSEIVAVLANAVNERRIKQIFKTYQPQTVYHAAAYKHVPLVESNPSEGVTNNVCATLNTARQALEHGVDDFVLISTDKAVRPTNVMGASKRISELVIQAMADDAKVAGLAIRLSMVRFGNVLGSSGSVVPRFRKQIKHGGPITLTDERITRYFMTLSEAAQLVIQAGGMAKGGEVFLLDMGESVKIIDLAKKMIELSGLSLRSAKQPDGDIEISVTGLRPGEKLYEELLIGEDPMPTAHPGIMKAQEDFLPFNELGPLLDELLTECDRANHSAMVRLISLLVAGYKPQLEVTPQPAAGPELSMVA